ncbi:hypothetical protein ACFL20_05400 [Spirochaetota bacterium]
MMNKNSLNKTITVILILLFSITYLKCKKNSGSNPEGISCDPGYEYINGYCREVFSIGEGSSNTFQPLRDNSNGLSSNGNGGLKIDYNAMRTDYVWIANSDEDTVSKIDVATGCEKARYFVCNRPNRIAVDRFGNAVVACLEDSQIVKLSAHERNCVDSNNNTVINTSTDVSGDCVISPDEMVANDECILWSAVPDNPSCTNSCGRAVGVDRDNNIWAGFYASKKLIKLDGDNGTILDSIVLSYYPYGLAIDSNGSLWISSRDGSGYLVKIDPSNGAESDYSVPGNATYHLAIDPFDKVWVASGEDGGVHRFDPSDETWDTFSNLGRGHTRDIAISSIRDSQGDINESKVFVSHHTWATVCTSDNTHRYISVINALTHIEGTPIDLGSDRAPIALSLDSNNSLWSANRCDSSTSKINTYNGSVIGTYPVGLGPYVAGDQTGHAFQTIVSPSGYIRTVKQGYLDGNTSWDGIDVDATLSGSTGMDLQIRYRTADSEFNLREAQWQGPILYNSLPAVLNNVTGNYIEVEVVMLRYNPLLSAEIHSIKMMAHKF